jgi:hypothetical protein
MVLDLITGKELGDHVRRTIISPQKLDNLLLVDQPTAGSCINVIDGGAVELSDRTRDRMVRIAPYSQIGRIIPEGEGHTPPAALFGPEPAHGWCYFYQKASLARQRGDWAEVARLGDEAMKADPRPAEWVEWMPFLQAYAYLGRYAEVDRIKTLYDGAPFLRNQACNLFTQDARGNGEQFPEGQAYLINAFCY